MSFILDTDVVDEGDRAEFVHEALGMTMVPIELHWSDQLRGGRRARHHHRPWGTSRSAGGDVPPRTAWNAPLRWPATLWNRASSSTYK